MKVKMVVIGDSGVGKSTFIQTFSGQRSEEEAAAAGTLDRTIGVEYVRKVLPLAGIPTELQLWDTSGLEKYRSLTFKYFRLADGFVLAYDLTDRKSFDNVPSWVQEVATYGKAQAAKLLVGTKAQFADRRKVSFEEGKALATFLGAQFREI